MLFNTEKKSNKNDKPFFLNLSNNKPSLLEKTIVEISLNQIFNDDMKTEDECFITEVREADITGKLNTGQEYSYSDWKNAVHTMMSRALESEDTEKRSGNIRIIPIVDRAYYKSGILTVGFNKKLNLRDVYDSYQ